MSIYISGKIGEAAISETTRKKFQQVEELLRGLGCEVFNPTDEKWQMNLRRGYEEQSYSNGILVSAAPFYTYALLRDLMVLALKDAIFLLPDWQQSPGARVELAFAKAIGLDVYEQTIGGGIKRWKEADK